MRACLQSFINRWERSAHGHSHSQLQYITQDVKYKRLTANVRSAAASALLIVASLVIQSAVLSSLSVFFFILKKEILVLMSDIKIQHIVT